MRHAIDVHAHAHAILPAYAESLAAARWGVFPSRTRPSSQCWPNVQHATVDQVPEEQRLIAVHADDRVVSYGSLAASLPQVTDWL